MRSWFGNLPRSFAVWRPKEETGVRKARLLISAILLLGAVLFLYETGLMNSVSIPSACRKICIPAYFWFLVLLYSFAASIAYYGRSWKEWVRTSDTLIFGFALHIYILLYDLVISLSNTAQAPVSGVYLYYIKAILILATTAVSTFGARLIYCLLRKKSQDDRDHAVYRFLFFLPIFLAPVYFLVTKMNITDRLLFAVLCLAYAAPFLYIRIPSLAIVYHIIRRLVSTLRDDRSFIIFIFILAFLIRCLFALNVIAKTESQKPGSFVTASDDGDVFDRKAVSVVENDFDLKKADIHIWNGRWEEAYSVFLALIYKIFGRNFYYACIIQAFLGSFLPVFIFLIGRIIFSGAVGRIAALAMCLKGPIIFLSIVFGHEAIWLPLLVLFVLFLTRLYNGMGRMNAFWAGLTLGVIIVFRGLYIFMIPLLFLWVILFWGNRLSIPERLKSSVFMGLALWLVISVTSQLTGGFSLGDPGRRQTQWEVERLYEPFNGIGNKRLSAIGVNLTGDLTGSIVNICKQPIAFLRTAASIYPLRIIAYLEVYQFGFFDPIYLVNSANWPNNFMSNLEFYFTAIFIAGLLLCIKRREIISSPIFIVLAFHLTVHALIFCNMAPRYKDSSSPFIYIIGSFGLVEVLKRLKIIKAKEGIK